jgi:F-type H+-transporting ATPase subunit b
MAAHTPAAACELRNKVRILALLIVLFTAGTLSVETLQPGTDHAAPSGAGQSEAHAADEEHPSMWGSLLWPTVNFAILFGGLWYFLKTPITSHLRDRDAAIRKDLVEAGEVKATAASQLAEIDRKLKALPGEIEALRTRGAEEIAAEEARIAALATAERERLLEQTRREIELQLRIAKHELVEHTADLAVQLAGERISRQITPVDQERIVDRYLEGVNEGQRSAQKP